MYIYRFKHKLFVSLFEASVDGEGDDREPEQIAVLRRERRCDLALPESFLARHRRVHCCAHPHAGVLKPPALHHPRRLREVLRRAGEELSAALEARPLVAAHLLRSSPHRRGRRRVGARRVGGRQPGRGRREAAEVPRRRAYRRAKGRRAEGVVHVGIFGRDLAASVADEVRGGFPEEAEEQEEGSEIGLRAHQPDHSARILKQLNGQVAFLTFIMSSSCKLHAYIAKGSG